MQTVRTGLGVVSRGRQVTVSHGLIKGVSGPHPSEGSRPLMLDAHCPASSGGRCRRSPPCWGPGEANTTRHGWWAVLMLCSSSQYMAFFEFNSRLEAILSKAYVYR